MSEASSRTVEWSTRLEPVPPTTDVFARPDDPRLGEVVAFWKGDPAELTTGRAVLIGFPQDEGVRRNHGRPGAAEAPHEVRRWLHRLPPFDAEEGADLTRQPPLDLGNVRLGGTLEDSQQSLAEVVHRILAAGAIPIILGGGHETAYGHYLGYLACQRRPGIINLDAHLDVRPCAPGQGHSGSPFFQALEHTDHPLPGAHYVCLGAQPHVVSRQHFLYARERGCSIRWRGEQMPLVEQFATERDRLAAAAASIYVTIDADAVRAADVPGVSAPNPSGFSGREVIACARTAGRSPAVSSLDLVEINPRYDRDGQSARWAALVVWNFLVGLAGRPGVRGNRKRTH
jgi:formiminoglutamase